MHRPYRTILALLALLAAAPLAAQQTPEPAPAAADTAEAAGPSARGAFLRSVVLPGWGQAYVGSPGRGSVYFALEAASLWMVYKSWRSLDQARVLDEALRAAGELEPDEKSGLVRSRERQREDWVTLAAFVLLLSGADAYVAAQLADFSERIGVEPAPDGAMQLRLTLPLGAGR